MSIKLHLQEQYKILKEEKNHLLLRLIANLIEMSEIKDLLVKSGYTEELAEIYDQPKILDKDDVKLLIANIDMLSRE